ncbi:transglycosylase SLT domain-containing protein [Geobacter sp. SVR]|uniref:lytic transglycosylase domain-containing protein n=1 Tax=Geobacter sp. SVR TaxID=2495594 RepID=UPI00143EF6A7|nr:transglycosylase SLT domain-containing protein [Geobacter sp. SVR]BCS52981.1 murein transglycosylase [Geobacter sp. SVR]GCF84365.1 murein transglycosylase [Geobacter sp. SVR]
MQRFKKVSIIILAVVSLFAGSGFSSSADDLFARAVSRFRQKDYAEGLTLAGKTADTPQRTFFMGVSAMRIGHFEEAVPLLKEAEQKLPLVADYAALYQVEALLKLKRYTEAASKAAAFAKAYPSSLLIRRAEKFGVDAQVAAGDYKGALRMCDLFIEKYPSGSDSVDVLYQSARCREETDDKVGAAQIYRSIWLNNPLAAQAKKSRERLGELEKGETKVAGYTADELLRRASALFTQNEFSQSLQVLQSIPSEGQPAAVVGRIAVRSGMAYYRLRNYKEAEKSLAAAIGIADLQPAIRSEARLWHARAIERQDQSERAFALYMELVGEGKKQEFAADALMEAAGLRRGQGRYTEAAPLFEQVTKNFPESRFVGKAAWDAAWCRYLAGEYPLAVEALKALLNDGGLREKALYWLARSLENTGSADAAVYYRMLLDEYPAGFYAVWHREQKGIKDEREQLAQRVFPAVAVPACFDKPRLLASLGMQEEARNEMGAARKKAGEKKVPFSDLARLYLEIGDYGSAIATFLQNRPVKWEKSTLQVWSAGYPLAYSDLVAQHTSTNSLSEALIYALIRAESAFSPTVKSHAGAIGLMQLMPATARATARDKGTFDPACLTIPEQNIKLGTKHFRELLKAHDGNVVYSVAAYNAGTAAVERWKKNLKGLRQDEFIESIPYQETRDYVKKVYASAATYRQLYGLR